MTPASKATVVIGFSLAGPTSSAITLSHHAVPGGRSLLNPPVVSFLAIRSVVRGSLRCDRYRLVLAAVLPHRPHDADELVRESDGSLVVPGPTLEFQGPGAEGIVSLGLIRVAEDGPRAVDQEHAQVGISALGDPPQTLPQPRSSIPGA